MLLPTLNRSLYLGGLSLFRKVGEFSLTKFIEPEFELSDADVVLERLER